MGEGAYRPGSKTSDLGRHGREAKALVGQPTQVAQVLDNGDICAEQGRMHGPAEVANVIDVERIDPDERGALLHKVLGGFESEKWMSHQVHRGPPMRIPAGVDQHGLAYN